MARARNYVFTLNNYTQEDEDWIKAGHGRFDYVIYGKEVGESKTPHLQGYIELPTAVGIKRVKALLDVTGTRAHLEPRRGTQQQAITYCMKDGDFVEIGERKKQGERTDLKGVREMIEKGSCMREVMYKTDSYQAIRYAEKVLVYFERKRMWNPNIIWIYGNSGFGKSHLAHSLYEDAYVLNISKWWQSYDSHDTVIIDNFTEDFAPIATMLKLLDKYPFQVEYKGGSRQLLARNYIITTVRPPHEHYGGNPQMPELIRRLNEYGIIYHLKEHHSERDDTPFLAHVRSKDLPGEFSDLETNSSLSSNEAGPA